MNQLTALRAATSHSRLTEGLDIKTALTFAADFLKEHFTSSDASMPLAVARGRILAEPIQVSCDLPPFDTALIDGYAIKLDDLVGDGPWELKLAGSRVAGDIKANRISPKAPSSIAVNAGAVVPDVVDAIVDETDVTHGCQNIILKRRPTPKANIVKAGSTFAAGTPALEPGVELTAAHLGFLAGIGLPTVRVRRKLPIVLMSTGSELVDPGSKRAKGQIYDSNRPMLKAALDRNWTSINDLGIVGDDIELLKMVLQDAAENHSVVISTGATGQGSTDYMRDAILDLGGNILVSSIAMTPGHTAFIATLGGALLLALPGDPATAWMGVNAIGTDIVCAAAQLPVPSAELRRGQAAARVPVNPHKQTLTFVQAKHADRDGTVHLEPLKHQSGQGLDQLLHSDGIAVVENGGGAIKAGDPVAWLPDVR